MSELPRFRQDLLAAQGGLCMYCGIGLLAYEGYIDLKIPAARGGEEVYRNLQLLCAPCRHRKGNRTDEEFRERYLLSRKAEPPRAILPEAYFTNRDRELMRWSALTARTGGAPPLGGDESACAR